MWSWCQTSFNSFIPRSWVLSQILVLVLLTIEPRDVGDKRNGFDRETLPRAGILPKFATLRKLFNDYMDHGEDAKRHSAQTEQRLEEAPSPSSSRFPVQFWPFKAFLNGTIITQGAPHSFRRWRPCPQLL